MAFKTFSNADSVTGRLKNAQFGKKVAKAVAKLLKFPISTSKLNRKVQNIYIKQHLKP
jgi:hypothetical protein